MDCCTPKKEPEKNKTEIENAKQTGTHEKEGSPGGCCGGGNMKLHLLLMVIVFALIWFLSGR